MAENKTPEAVLNEAIARSYTPDTKTLKIGGANVEIKTRLTLAQALGFVEFVVSACYGQDGSYMPEMLDFATDCAVLTLYGGFTLPDDMSAAYDMVTRAGWIVDEITEHINPKQYASLVQAVDERIDQINQSRAAETMKKLDEISEAFDGIVTKMGDLFGGLTGEDMKAAINAIGENGIDEEKLMKAYVEAKEK